MQLQSNSVVNDEGLGNNLICLLYQGFYFYRVNLGYYPEDLELKMIKYL